MSGEPMYRPPLGVAPSVAMDGPVLPRRGLSAGAIGHGSNGRRYRLLAPMERGGMGELFLTLVSRPGHEDHHVVVKRLLADLVDDPKYVEMFKSEAWVMQHLEHENIVGVYDNPIIDRAQCLAMELVRGKSAQQILARCEARNVSVPPTVALQIMAKILRALEYAHAFRLEDGAPLNLVHRDVSPGNVLVSYAGDVKLTDFGIAKSQMSVVSTTVGIVKGKARYLAPEQILGEPASPRSDIFSAAAVTCELLTQEPTFDCSSVPKTLYAIVNGERKNLTQQLSFRAPMLVQLLDRALATTPSERVQTAAELAAGFEAQVRVLGPQVGSPDVGEWLTDLFAGEEDALAQFMDRPAVDEGATEHGYRPQTPLPAAELPDPVVPDTVLERPAHPAAPRAGTMPATEVLERPRVPPPLPHPTGPVAPSAAPAFRATISGGDTEPPSDPPSPRGRTVVEAELMDPAPSVEGFADETQVVRRRNRPIEDSASMGEALSMLAFLQQQQAEKVGDTKTLPKAAPSPQPVPPIDDALIPELRPQRGGKVIMLLLGVALGVIATLGVQAVSRRPSPPKTAALAANAPPAKASASSGLVAAAAEPPASDPADAVEPPPEPADPEPLATPAATLDVVYPRGARVYLDGEALPGRVPMSDIELPPGPHELRVRKRRYKRRVRFDAAPGVRFEMGRKLARSEPTPP